MTPQPIASPRPVSPLAILASTLGRLSSQADAMDGLDPAFSTTLKRVERLAGGLEPYLGACSTPESADLTALAERTRSENWTGRFRVGDTAVALQQEMLSGHLEGQFLKLLIHVMRAERVLEIGLFTGYSALAMAEALPADGRLVACEIDPFAAAFARSAFDRSPHGQKISIEIGPAAETLRRLQTAGASFDLIFIDADKGGYIDYYNLILDGPLLRDRGLICVDNTLMQGEPYLADEPSANGAAISNFNRVVAEDHRVEQVLLPLRDGLTLIRRR